MMFMPELNHISYLTYHTAGFTAITSAFLKHLQHIIYIILLLYIIIITFFFLYLWCLWVQNFNASVCDHHLQEWTLNPFLSLCQCWLKQLNINNLYLYVSRQYFLSFSLCHPSCKNTFLCGLSFYLLRIMAKLSTTILSKMVSWSTAIKNGCGKEMTAVEYVWPVTCTKSCRF